MADPGGANNSAHLTLPDNQAALAPFPPGCPVVVSGSSVAASAAAAASSQTYLGQVHSVYIDLGSTTRDNFYRVRPSSAASAAAAINTELRSAAESALTYAPGCTVTVNASALPPFVAEGGGGDTRDATIISCVGGGVSGSNSYYLLKVMPGPDDSWTNIQSTVPVDSVRYRAPTVEGNEVGQDGDQDNRAINNPHPHMIPADEDGSLKSTSKDPPVASIAFNNTGSRKRPAQLELDADDGGSSTLSPMPTDGSISIASSNAIAEEVVRRIDIPDTVDVSKVKGALVGSDNKINQRMQTKFGVIISILGLDDAVSSSVMELFSKLGPISYKVGDKCIMIQGPERKVHDAAKVVIHMLVNKCYEGNDKDTLMRKLRVVRQVRKKADPSPPRAPARSDLASPTKKLKTGPTAAEGDAASLAAAAKDPVERGWSPPVEEDPQPQIDNAGSARERPRGLLRDPIWVEKDGSSFWQSDVISSLPETELFGRIVGDCGENKKRLEHKFSRVFFSIRGKGIRLKTGMQSEGPLRVEVGGNNKEDVSLAAHHIAKIINFNQINDRLPTDSASRPLSRPLKHSQDPEAPHEIINNNGSLFGEPAFRDEVWSVQVRSIIDERELFKNFIGTQYNIRSRLVDRFYLSHIGILKYGGIQRILIEGSDKVGVIEAAKYAADTMHVMAKPVTKQFEATLSTTCSWDGKRWLIDVVSPLSYDAAFGTIVGPGGSIKERLRKDLDCFSIFLRGGNGIRGENSALPPHVRITDGIRTIVEDAGDHIAKLLQDAKAMAASNDRAAIDSAGCASNHPPKRGRNRLLMEEPNFDGRDWLVKLLSPLDRDSTFDFIIGSKGSRKRALEKQFPGCFFFLRGKGSGSNNGGGQEGNNDSPLHILITSLDRSIAEAASAHIAEVLLKATSEAALDPSRRDRSCAYPSHDQRRLDQPFWSGSQWEMAVESPIPEKALFDVIVGPGGRNKKQLTQRFGSAYFTICGEGIVLKDGTRSEGPLRVCVQADDKDYTLRAVRHISEILEDANRQRNMHFSPESINAAYDLIAKPSFSEQIREWHVNIRSLLGTDSLFDIMIGLGGASKKEFEMRHPNCTVAICSEGIETFDRRPGVGPLRVLVRGKNRDNIIAAAEHAARMIYKTHTEKRNGAFFERIRSLIGETTMRGIEHQVKIRSPINEEMLCDTVFGRNNSQRNKILAVYPSCDISIDGGGIRGNFEESLHVRIVNRRKDSAENAAGWIAKMIINREVCSLCY